jgi:RNA polymerase sigma-70 factor, ECF subfamily
MRIRTPEECTRYRDSDPIVSRAVVRFVLYMMPDLFRGFGERGDRIPNYSCSGKTLKFIGKWVLLDHAISSYMRESSALKIEFTDEQEKELLELARQGDQKAFDRLVKRYQDMVYNFSFKVCRNQEYAEETLQDTFVNVYRKLNQFDGKSKFSTWLYTIVTNNCLMKRRRRKLELASVSIHEPRMPEHSHDTEDGKTDVPSWRNTPLEEAMGKELRRELDNAIEKLPLDYRITFILRDIEGKSAEETAQILKLSVPAVKSRLRRARVFLRNELNEYMTQ